MIPTALCSHSGLAVYLNIDSIAKMLPPTARVRGLASAGYFLDFQSGSGGYADQMLVLAKEQNSSAALSPVCVAKAVKAGYAAEKCFFAEYAVGHMDTPTFALQSRFDTWQLAHIAHTNTKNTTGVEAYGDLIFERMAPIIRGVEQQAGGVQPAITSSSVEPTPTASPTTKHAVWLSPCETHGLGVTSFWTESTLNGTSPALAFQKWFDGELDNSSRVWLGTELNSGCH
jgi:hypothetical protein